MQNRYESNKGTLQQWFLAQYFVVALQGSTRTRGTDFTRNTEGYHMITSVRTLSKSGPYSLQQHYSKISGDRYYIVSIDKRAWTKCNTSQTTVNEHFSPGSRHSILSWRYRNKEEPTELISLAILKGLV